MEAIPLDAETINSFQANGTQTDYASPEAPGGDPVEQLNEVANWLLKTADTALGKYTESLGGTPEEVEQVKWDEDSRERVSELSVLVARRNFSDEILKASPEIFLGTIVTGKLVEVGIVLSQINRRQAKQESQPSENANDEQ